MKRKGLLMIELLIAMLIITITAGAFSLAPDFWTLTAKREAEKLAAKLNSLMLRSDSIKKYFRFSIDASNNRMIIQWDNEPDFLHPRYSDEEYFDADKGCSFRWNYSHDHITYSHLTNRFNGGTTITITGKGPSYYVVIAAIESRVRVSAKAP